MQPRFVAFPSLLDYTVSLSVPRTSVRAAVAADLRQSAGEKRRVFVHISSMLVLLFIYLVNTADFNAKS